MVEVRFVNVGEPRRIVEEADFVSEDPDLAGTMTMAWSLEPVDGGTLVVITATDVPDGISSQDHATAFASTLSNLNAYVSRSSHCASRTSYSSAERSGRQSAALTLRHPV